MPASLMEGRKNAQKEPIAYEWSGILFFHILDRVFDHLF